MAEARGVDAVAADEVVLVQLVDAGGADRQAAFFEALAVFGAQQGPLGSGDARRNRQVVIGRQRQVVRRLDAEAVGRTRRDDRHQEAGLALHAWVGRGEVGHVRQRHAEKLDPGVLEIHHLFSFVVDDADRLDLPQRRLLGIVLARLASGIDTALEHRVVGVGAVRAGGRHSRLVDGFETQRIDETVAEVVAEVELFAVADLAVGLGQARIAFRMQSLAALVVDHLVGFDRRPVVVDLHIADGGNQFVGVVVPDLVGLNEHLPIGVLLGDHALAGGLRPELFAKIEEFGLRGGRPDGRTERDERSQKDERRRSDASAATPTGRACASRAHHHPPPRFNNESDPARPPHFAGA